MLDGLGAFYLVCFLFGAVFTTLSLLSGVAHLPLAGGHVLHLGHGVHVHGAHAPGHENSPAFNLGSVLAFLTWFGGVGFLLHTLSPLGLLVVLLLSLAAGFVGGTLIAFFVAGFLWPAQTVMDPAQYRLDGTRGRITAAIPAGGTGEISYSKAGTHRSDAARSLDGQAIPHGTEVVILTYTHGIAYVQPLEQYLTMPAAEVAGRLTALGIEAGDQSGNRKQSR